MGPGVDDRLDGVADRPAVPRTGRHGAGIRIGQGDLAVRRIGQGLVHRRQPVDLLPDAAIAAGQMLDFLDTGLAFLLPVDAHPLGDGAFDIGFWMREAAGDLALDEVAVAVVDGFDFAANDGDAIPLQRADPAAERDEPGTGLADRRTGLRANDPPGPFSDPSN